MRTPTGRRALRRLAVASVVPLALGTLAACGDHARSAGAAPTAPASAARASDAPAAAHGATQATTPTRNELDPAAFTALVRSGVADLSTVRMSMTTSVRGRLVSARGAMDLTGSHPAMKMSMDLTGMGTPTEVRLVDGVIYVQTRPGGMFATYDLHDARSPLGGSMGDLDPRSMISGLSPDAFRSVTDLGRTTVGGQRLEHYRVVVDTGSSATMLHAGAGALAKLPKQLTYELWLDDHHRMARFVMAMKKDLRITARYYGYGAPVHVSAPPPSQVVGAS